eukprot:15203946-Alexandrium_andersonii.AAC.1
MCANEFARARTRARENESAQQALYGPAPNESERGRPPGGLQRRQSTRSPARGRRRPCRPQRKPCRTC